MYFLQPRLARSSQGLRFLALSARPASSNLMQQLDALAFTHYDELPPRS